MCRMLQFTCCCIQIGPHQSITCTRNKILAWVIFQQLCYPVLNMHGRWIWFQFWTLAHASCQPPKESVFNQSSDSLFSTNFALAVTKKTQSNWCWLLLKEYSYVKVELKTAAHSARLMSCGYLVKPSDWSTRMWSTEGSCDHSPNVLLREHSRWALYRMKSKEFRKSSIWCGRMPIHLMTLWLKLIINITAATCLSRKYKGETNDCTIDLPRCAYICSHFTFYAVDN